MRIYFERSGGFTGISLTTTIDTTQLPPEQADAWQQLVQETSFFELPACLTNNGGIDQFQYTLTVETDEQQHTVLTTDSAAPESLYQLLQELTLTARRSPMAGYQRMPNGQ